MKYFRGHLKIRKLYVMNKSATLGQGPDSFRNCILRKFMTCTKVARNNFQFEKKKHAKIYSHMHICQYIDFLFLAHVYSRP